MATKAKKTEEVKDITVSLEVKTIRIPIEGISPLIMNRFDEKSKQQIEESAPGMKQGGKKKNIVPPEEQYERSIHYCTDGSCGFPANAFKDAMVTTAYRTFGRPMTTTRSAFHVIADDPAALEVQRLGEDMVRVGGIQKVAAPRYRAEFPVWSAVITIQFLANVITEEELIGLLNAAGFACGIGEWRPEKSSGSYGLFRVVNSK